MRLHCSRFWRSAAWLSCAFHFAAVIGAGAIVSGMAAETPRPEKLIAVDLTLEAPAPPSVADVPMADGGESGPADAAERESAPKRMPDSAMAARGADSAPSGAPTGAVSAPRGHEAGESGAALGQSQAREGAGELAQPSSAVSAAPAAGASPADRRAAIDRFVSLVERHKKYPYMALKRGQTGIASVHVRLSADGDLRAAEISASSGVKSLDEAALDAVRSASPFRHGLGEPLNMVVPVNYQLAG